MYLFILFPFQKANYIFNNIQQHKINDIQNSNDAVTIFMNIMQLKQSTQKIKSEN